MRYNAQPLCILIWTPNCKDHYPISYSGNWFSVMTSGYAMNKSNERSSVVYWPQEHSCHCTAWGYICRVYPAYSVVCVIFPSPEKSECIHPKKEAFIPSSLVFSLWIRALSDGPLFKAPQAYIYIFLSKDSISSHMIYGYLWNPYSTALFCPCLTTSFRAFQRLRSRLSDHGSLIPRGWSDG